MFDVVGVWVYLYLEANLSDSKRKYLKIQH
jgi:hypothetical protein